MSSCSPSSPERLPSLCHQLLSSGDRMCVLMWGSGVMQLQVSALLPHATQPLGLMAIGLVYSQTW